MELNTIKCADYLDYMRLLPDNSADAIITDPPYKVTELDFECEIDWVSFWQESKRILRCSSSPVIIFSQQPFTTDLIVSNRRWYRNEIIWHKTHAVGSLNANVRPMQAHENILVFSETAASYTPQMESVNSNRKGTVRRKVGVSQHYGKTAERQPYEFTDKRFPRSVLTFKQRDWFKSAVKKHPTAKPVPLMEWLIGNYTERGAVILDPFIGGGSTLVAAQNLGRNYLGCDKRLEWVDNSRQRLAQPFTIQMFN